jgi:hypothetical protein
MRLGIPGALIGGLTAAVVGAAIWAAITVTTQFQIGFMAIGVGILAGLAVRYFGGGSGPVFGILGALFALVGCALGNLLSGISFIATEEGLPFFEALSQFDWSQSLDLLSAMTSAMDFVFYAIAVYEGFKFGPVPDESAVTD